MEKTLKSAVIKAVAIYWGAIICLVYFAKWVDSNSHYIVLGVLLIIGPLVLTVLGVLIYRYFRRW